MQPRYPIDNYQEDDGEGLRHRHRSRGHREWQSSDARVPYPAYGTRFDRLTGYTIFDRDIVGFFYLLWEWVYTIAMIPIRLIILFFRLVFLFARMAYPFLFYVAIIWILWYLVVIFWPYVIDIVLTVAIPILNVLILLFNLFAQLFIFLWDIAVTIWNAVVPFIGMILNVVINLVLTILSDVFNAIGSFNWEPIISALMQIINILVEIAVQILVVLIKVGAEILTQVAKIITPLINFLLEVIKAVLPVVQWIFELLFDILEPILGLLGFLFGGGGGNETTSKGSSTGRRLFSMDVHPVVFTPAYLEKINIVQLPDNLPYSLTYDSLLKNLPKNISAHEVEEFERIIREIAKEPDIDIDNVNAWFKSTMVAKPGMEDYDSGVGRRLFEQPRQKEQEVVWKQKKTGGLRFVDDLTTPKHHEETPDEEDDGHLHEVSNAIARHMLASANNMRKDTLVRARETMNAIRAEVRHHSKLSIYTILQEEDRKMRARMPKFKETLASVEYPMSVKHPKHMVATFHEDLKKRQTEQFDTGRRTLGVNWNEAQQQQLDFVKVKHMRDIIQQTKQYTEFHQTNIKVINVAYAAFTRTMKRNMEEVITPEIVIKHWGSFLQSFGYKSLQEVHADYIKNYGTDPWEFMTAMSQFTEHPIIRVFKKADPSNKESPYWHDWATEQLKYKEDQQAIMGRKLLQMQSNGDDDVRGDGESKTGLASFTTISSLDCVSSPKNPFCLPLIPLSFKPRIPTINLSDKQVKTIKMETTVCEHWRFTNCIICWDRFYNAIIDVLFILSAIPFINYPIAQVTVTVPWTAPLLDWIFVVPKFRMPPLFEWVCFIFHLYDLFVTIVVLFVLFEILPELWDIFYTTWISVSRTFARRHKNSYFAKIRARAVQHMMHEIRIGASVDPNEGGGRNPRLPYSPRYTQNNVQVNNNNLFLGLTASELQHLHLARTINSVPHDQRSDHIAHRLLTLHTDHVDLNQGYDEHHVRHVHGENQRHPVNKGNL